MACGSHRKPWCRRPVPCLSAGCTSHTGLCQPWRPAVFSSQSIRRCPRYLGELMDKDALLLPGREEKQPVFHFSSRCPLQGVSWEKYWVGRVKKEMTNLGLTVGGRGERLRLENGSGGHVFLWENSVSSQSLPLWSSGQGQLGTMGVRSLWSRGSWTGRFPSRRAFLSVFTTSTNALSQEELKTCELPFYRSKVHIQRWPGLMSQTAC